MNEIRENAIEWYDGDDMIGISLQGQKFKTYLLKMSKLHPDEMKIHVNKDGSVFAKVPIKWLKIKRPVELSEAQLRQRREALVSAGVRSTSEPNSNETAKDEEVIV